MNKAESMIGKKCVECGKSLPKLHLGDTCIVCEAELERETSSEDGFEKFTKQKKGWK